MDSQKKIIIGSLTGILILAVIGAVLLRSTPEPEIRLAKSGNGTAEGGSNVITITQDTVVEGPLEEKDDPELISKLKLPTPTPFPETPVPPTPGDVTNNSIANAMKYDTSGIDSSEQTGPGALSSRSRRPGPHMNVARFGGGEGRVRHRNNMDNLNRPTPTPSGPTPTPDPDATETPEPTETAEPPQGSARIYLDPSSVTINPGETAELDLYIDVYEQAAGAYTSLILYNPLGLVLFQQSTGRDPYLGEPFVNNVNEQAGTIALSAVQGTVFDRPIGTGIHLFTLVFQGIEVGEYNIELAESEVANTGSQDVMPKTMWLMGESGTIINVVEPDPTDETEEDTPQ